MNRTSGVFLFTATLLAAAALAGCQSAGEDEIVAVSRTPEQGEASAAENDSDKPEERVCIGALTQEEMEEEHLSGWLSDNVEVDAYITPLSLYRDGLGEWDMQYAVTPEHVVPARELRPEDTVLDSCSFQTFLDAAAAFAETLGPDYRAAFEKTLTEYKETEHSPDFFTSSSQSIYFTTSRFEPAYEGITRQYLQDGEEKVDFLEDELVYHAAFELMGTLFPNISDHADFDIQGRDDLQFYVSLYPDSEYMLERPLLYHFECYEAVEGIPVKCAWDSCHIEAGDMDPESRCYAEWYEDEPYAHLGGPDGGGTGTIIIGDDGFHLSLLGKSSFTAYAEPQPVIDLNQVLETLKGKTKNVKVTEIELVMSDHVVGKEGEKKRIILHPYWRVIYYQECAVNGKYVMKRNLLSLDAYTGEKVHDGEY